MVTWSHIHDIIADTPDEKIMPFTFDGEYLSLNAVSHKREIRIYNNTGQIVFHSTAPAESNYVQNLSSFVTGFYILSINSKSYKLYIK